MGLAPSKTELYLPSDTIRVCSPDRCWCNGRHQNRASKYVYVERGENGREHYQDPVDIMGDFLMGGGGGAGMPWKSPGEWTVRDYERLGEVLNEWQTRERGRRRNHSSGNPMMGGSGGGMYGPSPWEGGGGGSGRRRRTHPSWGEFERMQETVEEKFRRMAEQYQRHMSERDSLLFGSASDHRREQYRNNMLKTLQEILPQLSQMMAAQQMGGGGGMNMNMGMGMQNGMPSGMPGGMPMGGVPGPGMGMQGGGMGMQGMGMNPMMNPMAAAATMGGGGSMGAMNMPGGGMNDMGGGGGFGRRGRGRRERPFREDFDEEFGTFGGGGAGRPGRAFRRGRKGGWGDDDEDMLGGFGGDGTSPRRPQGGPNQRPPRRPDGGFDDGGGLAHEHDAFGHPVEDLLRTAPPIPPQHAHFHTPAGYTRPQGMEFSGANRADIPERHIHPTVPPLRRSSPPRDMYTGRSNYPQAWPPATTLPMDPEIRPTSASGARFWPAEPSSTRQDTSRREAGFQPEAKLARPRDEEVDRKEPEAGAVPTKRDLQ